MKTYSLFILLALSVQSFAGHQNSKRFYSANRDYIKVIVSAGTDGSITVRSSHSMPLSFYLFNLEGKLIYQSDLKKEEEQVISGLQKGDYSYSTLLNDKTVYKGKLSVK